MSKSMRRLLPVFVALAVIAFVATTAHACPTCKDAVADNSPGGAQGATSGGDAAAGFNNAICLALGTVFTIIGGLGWRVYRAVNRASA
jgi:hypothetical protein